WPSGGVLLAFQLRLGFLVADGDLSFDRIPEIAPKLCTPDDGGDVLEIVFVAERVRGARRAVALAADEDHPVLWAGTDGLECLDVGLVMGVAGALTGGDARGTGQVP